MTDKILPLGKLPHRLLGEMLSLAPPPGKDLILGPGVGLDCAVVNAGDRLLVYKSEPITFATEEIGWYSVQVASNDIATTGALPRWYLGVLLLPEGKTTPDLVMEISRQVYAACQDIGATVIGGHTEITYGLDRPILVATLVGEVSPNKLITPRGARPGDRLLLTKGVPIEATALLAREFRHQLAGVLTGVELEEAAAFLHDPGISILKDARIALGAGRVHAMHDPTEGGLASAFWELADACGFTLIVNPGAVPIPPLAGKICAHFGLEPIAAIASGALLMSVHPGDSEAIRAALTSVGIPCAEVGHVMEGGPNVLLANGSELSRPERDEITRVFES